LLTLIFFAEEGDFKGSEIIIYSLAANFNSIRFQFTPGYSYDNDCVYVNGTGRDGYEYLIKLNRCGTLGASNHIEGRKEPSVS
jgi:hypothetical protein